MFRFIIGIAGLALLATGFIYLAPDSWKERTLEFIAEKPVIPDSIKEKIEDVLSTPHYRRTQIIEELGENLGSLSEEFSDETESGATSSPSMERAKRIIEESRKLIEKLERENAETPITSTAAKKLIEKIIDEQFLGKDIECATSTSQ